ncbi:uncharacterized protein LOC118505171 isoform X2 [Anopheles stephensi]|uniref:uncharacterized protein LOC118505171 isoform X2 n=1 Tax=Anopheles stephensi TaxID=30069 RepID=UPI00165877A0|nr:uncharacterized protein LOC118505171 isoform X2 [Anopheles stephensi]
MMEGDINNFLFGDDWPEEDFMSLLKMDDAMLFSGPSTNTACGSDELDDIMRTLNYSYSNETYLGEQQVTSPLSSHSSSDQEFHGFPNTTDGSSSGSLDGYFDEGYGVRMQDSPPMKQELINVDFDMVNVLEPGSPTEQGLLSSAASDSGLSSDHLDLDPNTEYEALSPGMSSPGPSISERGGQNSPPRYLKPVQRDVPMEVSPMVQQLGSQSLLSSQSANVTSQRTTQTTLPTAEKMVAKAIVTSINAPPQTMKTAAVSKISTATVYQQQTGGGVKALIAAGNAPKRIIATSSNGTPTSVPQQIVTNGKELKIIRMATMKNGQTVAVASGLTTTTGNSTTTPTSNKKVTLQLKNSAATSVKSTATVIPKNVVLTSSASAVGSNHAGGTGAVRKLIRMQQQTQQNGRQILVPVTIQDLRSIKIVSSTNMKSKSANIKLAAANMLQQSKQGLIQKNVVLSKDQLLVDDGPMSDAGPSSSDSESYVFEDIMQQSSSVIAEVERQQQQQQQQQQKSHHHHNLHHHHHHHHIISDSDVEPDGDDDGDDDDADLDEIGKGRNQNGTYQKLLLTAEEKRLLAKEGISLPTSYPLTKHEERELKRIRRKIRNKISAQDSRKRKKEYVDGLEERVKQCTEENQNLVKRIKILQSQNHDLVSQMKRIQSLLTKGTSKTTQPATCLMVLLISMALVAVPNLKLGNTATQQNIQDSIEMSELMQDPANEKLQHVQQSRRALLFDTKHESTPAAIAGEEELLNFDELMSSFNANALIANEHDYFGEADGRSGNEPPSAKRAKLMAAAPTTLIDYDVDDEVWNGGSKIRIKQEAGSMSPDSSSASELFEQKLPKTASGAPSPQVIVDRELFELVDGKQDDTGDALYDMHLLDSFSVVGGKGAGIGMNDGIDLLGVRADRPSVVSADSTADNANGARKLNASQQIQQQQQQQQQQQNNKRKLLL